MTLPAAGGVLDSSPGLELMEQKVWPQEYTALTSLGWSRECMGMNEKVELLSRVDGCEKTRKPYFFNYKLLNKKFLVCKNYKNNILT